MPLECGSSGSEQIQSRVGGGDKGSGARSKARCVSGAMPGHRLLPATHSFRECRGRLLWRSGTPISKPGAKAPRSQAKSGII